MNKKHLAKCEGAWWAAGPCVGGGFVTKGRFSLIRACVGRLHRSDAEIQS